MDGAGCGGVHGGGGVGSLCRSRVGLLHNGDGTGGGACIYL